MIDVCSFPEPEQYLIVLVITDIIVFYSASHLKR